MKQSVENKIHSFFTKGDWRFKKQEILDNIDFFEKLFDKYLIGYKPDTNKDKKLIKGYLSQKQNFFYINDRLIKFLFNLNKKEFIRLIRFYKIFENDQLFKELIEPIKTDNYIVELLSEIELIKKQEQKINKLQKQIESELYSYDFYQLLFLLAVWIDYKYLQQINAYQYRIVALDPYYVQSLSFIIREIQILGLHKNVENIKPANIQERFYNFLMHYEENYQKWLKFEALMSKVLEIIRWNDIYEFYCYQNARMIKLDDGSFTLIPDSAKNEIIWRKNEHLQNYLERFYENEALNIIPLEIKLNPYARPWIPVHSIELYYNGMPNEIEFKDKKLKILHLLTFFEGVRNFHKSRYYEALIEVYKEDKNLNIFQIIRKVIEPGDQWFKPIMGPLNVIDSIKILIDRILEEIYFPFPIKNEQIEKNFELFIYDLETDNDEFFNIHEQPFIKFDDKYFYVTTVFFANNPAYFLENRLLKFEAKERKKYEQIISKNFENVIAEIFKSNGFNVKLNIEIPETKDNKATDIDVLVWKGYEILVIQAKKTYRRLKASEIESYERQLEKAAYQLDTSISYIKKNTEKFLRKNKLGIKPDKLKIYGLIISNSPEGNFKKYQGYNKITAAELAIVLGDKKNEIINWELEALALYLKSKKKAIERINQLRYEVIRAAQIIYEEKLKKKFLQTIYWKDKEKTISNLMEAIENNYLWNDTLDVDIDLPSENASEDELLAYILFFKGKEYFEQGMYKIAAEILEKAYELNPNDRDIKMYLADSLAEIGKKEQAIKIYSDVIKEFPDYLFAYHNRAITYMELKKYKAAYEDFIKVLQIEPTNIQAVLTIIDLNENFGFDLPELPDMDILKRELATNKDERLKQFIFSFLAKNLMLDSNHSKPKNLDDFIVLITKQLTLASYTNDYSKVLDLIDTALAKYPNDSKLISFKAWIYKSQKKFDDAIKLCENAIKKNEKNSELWLVLGEISLEKNNINKAKELLNKAIEIDKNNAFAHYDLALIFEQENQLQLAIDELKQALKTERTDWKITFLRKLIEIYIKQNDYENALEYLEKAIEYGAFDLIDDWMIINKLSLLTDIKFFSIYF